MFSLGAVIRGLYFSKWHPIFWIYSWANFWMIPRFHINRDILWHICPWSWYSNKNEDNCNFYEWFLTFITGTTFTVVHFVWISYLGCLAVNIYELLPTFRMYCRIMRRQFVPRICGEVTKLAVVHFIWILGVIIFKVRTLGLGVPRQQSVVMGYQHVFLWQHNNRALYFGHKKNDLPWSD